MKMKIKRLRDRNGGFVSIVVGILVLTVGGFVVYELYQLAKHVKPVQYNDPTENTNDVTTYYTYGGSKTAAVKASNVTYSQPMYLIQGIVPNAFTFQYKVMPCSNGLSATLVVGTNLMDGRDTELVNNEDEYKIKFEIGSQTHIEDYDAVTGDLISETITPIYTGDPCTVVVQRMNTYIWENIATNSPCTVGAICAFSDTNSPADHAVYRLEIQ